MFQGWLNSLPVHLRTPEATSSNARQRNVRTRYQYCRCIIYSEALSRFTGLSELRNICTGDVLQLYMESGHDCIVQADTIIAQCKADLDASASITMTGSELLVLSFLQLVAALGMAHIAMQSLDDAEALRVLALDDSSAMWTTLGEIVVLVDNSSNTSPSVACAAKRLLDLQSLLTNVWAAPETDAILLELLEGVASSSYEVDLE
jgi:hypothetical protein